MAIKQTNDIVSKAPANRSCLHKRVTAQKTNHHLDLKTIQKILNKFLTERNMSKENLIVVLDLKSNELEAIFNNQASPELIAKINLPCNCN